MIEFNIINCIVFLLLVVIIMQFTAYSVSGFSIEINPYTPGFKKNWKKLGTIEKHTTHFLFGYFGYLAIIGKYEWYDFLVSIIPGFLMCGAILILTWWISKKTPEYVGKTVTICLRDGFGLYNVRIENTETVVLVKSKSGNLNYQWKDRHKIIDFRDNLYWIE